jgi:hypothetical protein
MSNRNSTEYNIEWAHKLLKKCYDNQNICEVQNIRGEMTYTNDELTTEAKVLYYNENKNFRTPWSNKNSLKSEMTVSQPDDAQYGEKDEKQLGAFLGGPKYEEKPDDKKAFVIEVDDIHEMEALKTLHDDPFNYREADIVFLNTINNPLNCNFTENALSNYEKQLQRLGSGGLTI